MEKICINCGAVLEGRRVKYCSDKCELAYNKSKPGYYDKRRLYENKHRSINKDKIAEKRKEYWTLPRTQYLSRISNLKTRYGISEGEYINLMNTQKGCCAVCLESLEVPYVDHCHATNVVRGLLCQLCNTAIGHFKDNELTMERAINYILNNKK